MFGLSSALIVEYGYIKLVLFEKRNGRLTFYAENEIEYDGFDEYGFINPEDVFTKVQKLFDTSAKEYGIGRRTAVVLPGTFCKISRENCEIKTNDGTVKRRDVDNLYASCGVRIGGYEPVEKIPVAFKTSASPATLNPIGEKSAILHGDIAVGYLKQNIKELFDNCSKRIGRVFTYTTFSTVIAEKAEKDLSGMANRIIVTIADGNMDAVLCKGGVPVDIRSELLGEGHISFALAEYLSVDETIAELLLKGVNLSLSLGGSYYLNGTPYPVKEINSIVIEAVQCFGKEIKKDLTDMTEEDYPIYITGSKICGRRGVKEIFEDELGREVYVLIADEINMSGSEKYLIAAIAESGRLCVR